MPREISAGLWSDRHGVTERNPTLAFSRASIDPGDLPQDRPVPKHGRQIPAPGWRRIARPHSQSVDVRHASALLILLMRDR
jgi:hypothetical protein